MTLDLACGPLGNPALADDLHPPFIFLVRESRLAPTGRVLELDSEAVVQFTQEGIQPVSDVFVAQVLFVDHVDLPLQSAPALLEVLDVNTVLPNCRLEHIEAPLEQRAQTREALVHLASGGQTGVSLLGEMPQEVFVQDVEAMVNPFDPAIDPIEPCIEALQHFVHRRASVSRTTTIYRLRFGRNSDQRSSIN